MVRRLAIALLLLVACATGRATDLTLPVVRLASLEWRPYSGDSLPGQGASVAVVRAALAARGHRLEVDFIPFTQAVGRAQDSQSGYHGYMPEYPSTDVEVNFVLSDSIGDSPLGFVERREAPVVWNAINDLRGRSIGLVRGYVNTAELDRMVASGEIIGVPAADDVSNLRSVVRGRASLAVVDRRVLRHLLHNAPELADARDQLQFNARPLMAQSLHVALQRSEKGRWALREINLGLKAIDIEAIVEPFFKPLGQSGGRQ